MRATRVAVGEVRAPDSDASGAFMAKIYWRLYAERLVAPKRRKVPGAFMPKTVWLLNGESSHMPHTLRPITFVRRITVQRTTFTPSLKNWRQAFSHTIDVKVLRADRPYEGLQFSVAWEPRQQNGANTRFTHFFPKASFGNPPQAAPPSPSFPIALPL